MPYAKNANTHTPQQINAIAKSIQKFGWTIPVLVDEVGMLITGHARILSAKKLGLTEVPVMVAIGWTEADKKAYSIADNQLGKSKFNNDLLVMELGDLASVGFDLELVGFDADSLSSLLSPLPTSLDDELNKDAGEPKTLSITVSVPSAIDIPSVAEILRRAVKASGYHGVKVKEPRA